MDNAEQTDRYGASFQAGGAEQGAKVGSAVGGALGVAAGRALGVGLAVTDTARDVGLQVRDRVEESDLPDRAQSLAQVIGGYAEQGRERGGSLLTSASRSVSGRTRPQRRWPWAISAALLGAAAGAAVAFVVRSLLGSDAPDAQEPEELRAVVDLGTPVPEPVPLPEPAVDPVPAADAPVAADTTGAALPTPPTQVAEPTALPEEGRP